MVHRSRNASFSLISQEELQLLDAEPEQHFESHRYLPRSKGRILF